MLGFFLSTLLMVVACTLPVLTHAELNSYLEHGDTGSQVRELQQALADLGYFDHEVTGYFGSITQAAVIQFQKANGISPAVGYFGPLTSAQLRAQGNVASSVNKQPPVALNTSPAALATRCAVLLPAINSVINTLISNGRPEDPFTTAGVNSDNRMLFFLPAIDSLPVRTMRLYFQTAANEYEASLGSVIKAQRDCVSNSDYISADANYNVAIYRSDLMRENLQHAHSLSNQVMAASYFLYAKATVVDPALAIAGGLSAPEVSFLIKTTEPIFDSVINATVSPDTGASSGAIEFVKAELAATMTFALSHHANELINKSIGQSGLWNALGAVISKDELRKLAMSALSKESNLGTEKAIGSVVDRLVDAVFSVQTAHAPTVPVSSQSAAVAAAVAAIYPKVSVSPSTGQRGTTFNEPGSGFTKNNYATLHFRKPDGVEYPTFKKQTDSNGGYPNSWTSSQDSLVGTYTYWAIDDATGKPSPSVTFQLAASPNQNASPVTTTSSSPQPSPAPTPLVLPTNEDLTKPYCNLSITKPRILAGQTSTIYWAARNLTHGALSNGATTDIVSTGSDSTAKTGSFGDVAPTETTTYSATFTGPNGICNASVTVTIESVQLAGKLQLSVNPYPITPPQVPSPPVTVDPFILITATPGHTSLVLETHWFTNNGSITEIITQPDGSTYTLHHTMTDASYGESINTATASLFGTYIVQFIDDATGKKSNAVKMSITNNTDAAVITYDYPEVFPSGSFSLVIHQPNGTNAVYPSSTSPSTLEYLAAEAKHKGWTYEIVK